MDSWYYQPVTQHNDKKMGFTKWLDLVTGSGNNSWFSYADGMLV